MKNLTDELARDIIKTYKIEIHEVEKLINLHLTNTPELISVLEKGNDIEKLKRTKIFKTFYKKLKKEIYFGLRTYQTKDNDHISTKERLNNLTLFINQLDDFLITANSVLDVGGGMFPKFFPFSKYSNVKKYVWIDKDRTSYQKLKEFKDKYNLNQLELYCEKIGERTLINFDVVFMLKLIPVISRQEKSLIEFLAKLPAKVIVVTGSKEAMVKKQNIQKREDLILKKFISLTNRKIVKEIDIQNEFGYVIS